jgi:effector-binding domain-containing protein
MKHISKIVIAIVVILAGLWGASLMLPSKVNAEASEIIPSTPDIVFAHVNDLRRVPTWSPIFNEDAGVQVDPPKGVFMGEGAYFNWTGGAGGGGTYTILESVPNQQVITNIKYKNDQKFQETFTFVPVNSGDAIKVTWQIEGELGNTPLVKLKAIGYTEKTSELMQRGLKQMKELCDKVSGSKSYATADVTNGTGKVGKFNIQEIDFPGRAFVAARKVLNFREMEGHFASFYPRIYQDLQLANLQLDGYPCGLYYNWDENSGKVDVAAAFPVVEAKDLDDEVKAVTLPAGKALLIEYVGSMDKISEAHLAMNEYISKKGYTHRPPVIEEYVSNQGQAVDPNKMTTKLFFLVE